MAWDGVTAGSLGIIVEPTRGISRECSVGKFFWGSLLSRSFRVVLAGRRVLRVLDKLIQLGFRDGEQFAHSDLEGDELCSGFEQFGR